MTQTDSGPLTFPHENEVDICSSEQKILTSNACVAMFLSYRLLIHHKFDTFYRNALTAVGWTGERVRTDIRNRTNAYKKKKKVQFYCHTGSYRCNHNEIYFHKFL